MNLIEAPSELEDMIRFEGIPAQKGFHFPAEWEEHEATWLSWPHNPNTWPGKMNKIWPAYLEFIKVLSFSEKVKINVSDIEMAKEAFSKIQKYGAELDQIYFYLNPTNDAWCRDHGPAFLVNDDRTEKIIIDWGYNAWGCKYPPFDLDDVIPTRIAAQLGLKVTEPGIVMEGGSVDFNGAGAVLTTTSCLLNKNRNPHLSKEQIEQYLREYYGVQKILWLGDGIVGDDTDGHIDDITRFISEDAVVTVVEGDKDDENYLPLRENRELLESLTINDSTNNESKLTIIDIPMPKPLYYEGQRLPASYANFYISNEHVIVPVFNSKNEQEALSILEGCFPKRQVVGIDSTHLVWGLGSFHCLSQQEPKIKPE